MSLVRVLILLAVLGALYLIAQRIGATVLDTGADVLARFA